MFVIFRMFSFFSHFTLGKRVQLLRDCVYIYWVIIFANSRITVTLGFCLRPLFTYVFRVYDYLKGINLPLILLKHGVYWWPFVYLISSPHSPSRHLVILILVVDVWSEPALNRAHISQKKTITNFVWSLNNKKKQHRIDCFGRRRLFR